MRKLLICLLLAGSALASTAATAQSGVEGRVQRLEGEMRAVQRKVFPGGNGQYVQPDNRPAPADDLLPGTPASSPVADLTTRVDSLEGQLRALTGQVETDTHRLQLLEARIKALEANAAAAPVAQHDAGGFPSRQGGDRSPEDRTPTDRFPGDRSDADRPSSARPTGDAVSSRPSSTPRGTSAKPTPAATAAGRNDPARAARVSAVERPETGDATEDNYLYGYRLWSAKLYPEAEAQFLSVTAKYPNHKRASYAQNLLGRSYLDDGKPSLASLAFLDNYKKWPDGDRAPESLLYLAQALVKLDKPAAQVCKVYTELSRSYAAKIDADPRMKAAIVKGRAESSCS